MTRRLFMLTACFLIAGAIGVRGSRPEVIALREPLSAIPEQIDRWTGREAPPLSSEVLAVLGADEYLQRFYVAPDEPLVSLFVGYYQSQRAGDTMHSPLNCLPGAGWQPVLTTRARLEIAGRPEPITVNQIVIQKGLDRQVALYWYQTQDRVVASEYWSKAYLVYDAIRLNRSEAALIRILSPVLQSDNGDEPAARRAAEFARALFPHLLRSLPS